MPASDPFAFQRKFDNVTWDERNVVEQASLIKEFIDLKDNLPIADVGKIEAAFQRKLSISRDEWFRLLVSIETERLKLLAGIWQKRSSQKLPIITSAQPSAGIYPQDGWLGEFVYDYGKVIESPDSFLFWSGVATLSAVVRRKLSIRFGTRSLYPNFYIILVARTGAARKGAPIKAAEFFARTIPDINFIDRTTTERLPHDLSYRIQTIGGQTQRVPCDASGFMCAEELVAFIGDQSYNSDVLKFLIEWWDCPDSKNVRSLKHGILQLTNLYITILGGTTPDWLQGSLSSLVAGGGMLNRTLFIVEERTPKMIPWPQAPDDNTKQRLIQQLAHIDSLQGEFVVTEEALRWTDIWYKDFRQQLESNEIEAASLERKQVHMIKLAMLLAVSEGKSFEINSELLKRADRILKEQEIGLPEIARSLLANPIGREHIRVLDFIRKAGGKIAHSDLLRKCSPYGIDKDGLKKISETLEESDEIIIDATQRPRIYRIKKRP